MRKDKRLRHPNKETQKLRLESLLTRNPPPGVNELERFFVENPRESIEGDELHLQYEKALQMYQDLRSLRGQRDHGVQRKFVDVDGFEEATKDMPTGSLDIMQSARLGEIRDAIPNREMFQSRLTLSEGERAVFDDSYENLVSCFLSDRLDSFSKESHDPVMKSLLQALLAVHDRGYLKCLISVDTTQPLFGDDDLVINPATFKYLIAELYLVIKQIIDQPHDTENSLWCQLVSLPTHHAGVSRGEGFCVLNSHGIIAACMSKQYQDLTVVAVGMDVNDDNGLRQVYQQLCTQNAFEVFHINCFDRTVYPYSFDEPYDATYTSVGSYHGCDVFLEERGSAEIMKQIVDQLKFQLDSVADEGKQMLLSLPIGWDSHVAERAGCGQAVNGAIRFDNADLCSFYANIKCLVNAYKGSIIVIETAEGGYTDPGPFFALAEGITSRVITSPFEERKTVRRSRQKQPSQSDINREIRAWNHQMALMESVVGKRSKVFDGNERQCCSRLEKIHKQAQVFSKSSAQQEYEGLLGFYLLAVGYLDVCLEEIFVIAQTGRRVGLYLSIISNIISSLEEQPLDDIPETSISSMSKLKDAVKLYQQFDETSSEDETEKEVFLEGCYIDDASSESSSLSSSDISTSVEHDQQLERSTPDAPFTPRKRFCLDPYAWQYGAKIFLNVSPKIKINERWNDVLQLFDDPEFSLPALTKVCEQAELSFNDILRGDLSEELQGDLIYFYERALAYLQAYSEDLKPSRYDYQESMGLIDQTRTFLAKMHQADFMSPCDLESSESARGLSVSV